MDLNLGDTQLILAECKKRGVLRNQAAYILATAKWETAHTMKPVREAFWLSDAWRKANLRYYPWYGRGYVQLTWKSNYERARDETGVNVIAEPDAAMRPEVAVPVLVVGCMEGWFTGKAMPDYVDLQRSDFVGARRVVNGTDKANQIASIARDYDEALKADGYGEKPAAKVSSIAKMLRAMSGGFK